MAVLDPLRFAYALAGTMLEAAWAEWALQAAIRRLTVDRRIRTPGLAARVIRRFPDTPAYADLAAFLHDDAGLRRAISRDASGPPPRLASLRSRREADERPSGLRSLELPKLKTEAALADWLDMPVETLCWYADVDGRNRKHPAGPLQTYRYRWIPRRNGPPRLLEIPKFVLKQAQRRILDEILARVPLHPSAHGFCPGRSILTNARPHCGQTIIIRLDLSDFFPSVASARVFRIFRTIGYCASVSRLLTGLCTTRTPAAVWRTRPGGHVGSDFDAWQRLTGRHLPQGAPTSPMLANLASARLDRRLSALAVSTDAHFTRYADDLTFSGGESLRRSWRRLAILVAMIAGEEGFIVNHRKTRVMRPGRRQHVTGVVVNVKPNLQRPQFDRLKAILTNCVRTGPAVQNRENRPDFRGYLAGCVAHAALLNPVRGERLMALFEQIEWTSA